MQPWYRSLQTSLQEPKRDWDSAPRAPLRASQGPSVSEVPTWAQAAQAAPSASASSSSMPLGTAAIQGYYRLLRTKNESRRTCGDFKS